MTDNHIPSTADPDNPVTWQAMIYALDAAHYIGKSILNAIGYSERVTEIQLVMRGLNNPDMNKLLTSLVVSAGLSHALDLARSGVTQALEERPATKAFIDLVHSWAVLHTSMGVDMRAALEAEIKRANEVQEKRGAAATAAEQVLRAMNVKES